MAKISEQAQRAANLPTAQERQQVGQVVPMSGRPPDMDEAELRETAGLGTSTAASDNIVPTVYILHYSDSRADERDHANYIQGARPGDIVLRGAPDDQSLVKSEEGLLFQPCVFWNDVTEWVPKPENGNGKREFVSRHGDVSRPMNFAKDVPGAKQGPKNKFHWLTADGHELIETRNFVGFAHLKSGLRLPFLISLKGTGHRVGKDWMTSINSKMSGDGKIYPAWAALYRLHTEGKSNPQNASERWFLYKIVPGIRPEHGNSWATKAERAAGLQLYKQFVSGEKQAEQPDDDQSGGVGTAQAQTADTNKVDASI